MRLIDADALPSALFQKHVHDDEELEPMLYFEDAVKVVEDAPTIDAIPVEWIQAQVENEKRAPLFRRYAEALLTIWQKEQEAQDG